SHTCSPVVLVRVGIACPAWGSSGRRFKSGHPDQRKPVLDGLLSFTLTIRRALAVRGVVSPSRHPPAGARSHAASRTRPPPPAKRALRRTRRPGALGGAGVDAVVRRPAAHGGQATVRAGRTGPTTGRVARKRPRSDTWQDHLKHVTGDIRPP